MFFSLLFELITNWSHIFLKAFLKKGEMEAKMLSALLTGVNRAFPYAQGIVTLSFFYFCNVNIFEPM